MGVLIILISVSVAIAAGFLAIFIISSKNGQFKDLKTPKFRILTDKKSNQKI